MRIRRLVIIFLSFLLFAASLPALQIDGIDFRRGQLLTFNEYEGQGSEGVPIDPFVGLGLPLSFGTTPFAITVRVDAAYREYLLTSERRPVPTQAETSAEADLGVAGVLGVIAGFQFGYSYHATEAVVLGLWVSPTVFLRVPVKTIDGVIEGMQEYFVDQGRFVYPETGASISYKFSPRWAVGLDARVLIPIYHLWDAETLPFQDQLAVGAAVVLRRRFADRR